MEQKKGQNLKNLRLLKECQNAEQKIEFKGWVQKKRSSGKVKFLLLRDGEGLCQCILSKDICETSSFELFSDLNQEMLVCVQGKLREEKRSPGGFEIQVLRLKILSDSKEYPISPKEHGIDFLMSHRHLWIRSERQKTILRLRHELIFALHEFFNTRGFTLTEAPIFTSNSCEGTTTLFKTQYFHRTAYLSQSGQLYMEALAAALGKVYCLGPVFRAEKSKTRRHLIEFWCVEPEIAFATLEDVMNLSEELVIFLIDRILKNKTNELLSLNRDIEILKKIKAPFPRLHYEEALDLLKKMKNKEFAFKENFGVNEEAFLSSQFESPLFIHHFPKVQKAFYMKEDPESLKHSLSFDLLASESYGEIIGGGQREDELLKLQKKIKEHQLNEKDFEWYLDLRRYGSFVHSGFGLGIERFLAWICGIPHVRETIPFGRLYDRLYP